MSHPGAESDPMQARTRSTRIEDAVTHGTQHGTQEADGTAPTRPYESGGSGGGAPGASSPELVPGMRLGGYRIEALLGEGGMGMVYRATHLRLQRLVAVKIMRPALCANQEFVDRFLREAQAGARITHPNVVTIHDADEVDGFLFMAFEYVPGGDLAQLIAREGPLAVGEALRLMADCCRGLQAIHQAGMVHRDIKPQNIFLDEAGQAKLGDLGLARGTTADARMTGTGVGLGTPAYMSPEQAEGLPDLDIRSDVHALGATLFALLTGKPPFTGATPYVVTKLVMTAERPRVRALRPGLALEIEELILRAMARDRSQRFADPTALLQAIEALRRRADGGRADSTCLEDRQLAEEQPLQLEQLPRCPGCHGEHAPEDCACAVCGLDFSAVDRAEECARVARDAAAELRWLDARLAACEARAAWPQCPGMAELFTEAEAALAAIPRLSAEASAHEAEGRIEAANQAWDALFRLHPDLTDSSLPASSLAAWARDGCRASWHLAREEVAGLADVGAALARARVLFAETLGTPKQRAELLAGCLERVAEQALEDQRPDVAQALLSEAAELLPCDRSLAQRAESCVAEGRAWTQQRNAIAACVVARNWAEALPLVTAFQERWPTGDCGQDAAAIADAAAREHAALKEAEAALAAEDLVAAQAALDEAAAGAVSDAQDRLAAMVERARAALGLPATEATALDRSAATAITEPTPAAESRPVRSMEPPPLPPFPAPGLDENGTFRVLVVGSVLVLALLLVGVLLWLVTT